jgi:hypothetical protein
MLFKRGGSSPPEDYPKQHYILGGHSPPFFISHFADRKNKDSNYSATRRFPQRRSDRDKWDSCEDRDGRLHV